MVTITVTGKYLDAIRDYTVYEDLTLGNINCPKLDGTLSDETGIISVIDKDGVIVFSFLDFDEFAEAISASDKGEILSRGVN